MHWNKLPNIWLKRVQLNRRLDREVVQRLKAFRRVRFDFQRAAQQCRIKLHYQDSSGINRELICTVADAIDKYLRPGRWLVPKDIPQQVYRALEQSVAETIDYRNNEPYPAILEYVLVQLETKIYPSSQVAKTSGPQMFLLDCLPDFPHRDQDIVNKVFKTLTTGNVSTIAITTRYTFEKPDQPSEQEHEDQLSLDDGEVKSGSAIEGLQIEAGRNHSHEFKALDQSSKPSVNANDRLQTTSRDIFQEDVERPENANSHPLAEAQDHFKSLANSERIMAPNSIVAPLDEKALAELRALEQIEREDQAWQQKIKSNRSRIPSSSSGETDGMRFPPVLQESSSNRGLKQSENTLYPSHYTTSTPVEDDKLENEGLNNSSSVDSPTTRSQSSQPENTLYVTEPFGPQILDRSLTLYRQAKDFYKPSEGTYRILAWASKYMPHMWPDVIAACMPEGCKIDIQPRTDTGTIQYVIQPPLDKAVRATLRGYQTRATQEGL